MADSGNVRVGYSGFAYYGAVGVTAPEGPYVPWGANYTDLGLITEDGLTESFDEDRTVFKAWGRNAPVRTQTKNRTSTFKLTFMETSADTLSLYYAVPLDNMTSSGSGAAQYLEFDDPQNTEPMYVALGLDIVDGDNHFRYLIPKAEITDRGDIVSKDDEVHGYEVTFTALLPDDGGAAVTRFYGGVELPTTP